MKLKLDAIRDINILVVEGAITNENFAILRAGIKKLFKDGKNKIILELPDSGGLDTAILRELAGLNLLAAELSGSIVLAKIDSGTRSKIEAFSKPPFVTCYSDRASAAEHFHPKIEEKAPAPTPPAPMAAAANEEKTKLLKTEIRTKELGEIGTVRKQLSELESENGELKKRLAELVLIRREPPDIAAWREKVTLLEKQLSEAIKTAQDVASAKK